MSIEQNIQRQADALEAIALHLGTIAKRLNLEAAGLPVDDNAVGVDEQQVQQEAPQRRAKKKAAKKKAAKKKAARRAAPAVEGSTAEDVREVLIKLERDQIQDVLKQCGAEKLSELDPDMYIDAINIANEILGSGGGDGETDPLA